MKKLFVIPISSNYSAQDIRIFNTLSELPIPNLHLAKRAISNYLEGLESEFRITVVSAEARQEVHYIWGDEKTEAIYAQALDAYKKIPVLDENDEDFSANKIEEYYSFKSAAENQDMGVRSHFRSILFSNNAIQEVIQEIKTRESATSITH